MQIACAVNPIHDVDEGARLKRALPTLEHIVALATLQCPLTEATRLLKDFGEVDAQISAKSENRWASCASRMPLAKSCTFCHRMCLDFNLKFSSIFLHVIDVQPWDVSQLQKTLAATEGTS